MWWKQGVIYQIYPRSFQDGNGDGIGDLTGIRKRLDYLQWLGIDAIWFSPLFISPMADFGYDVADYCDIHPDYGTLEQFDQLLGEAHDRDIRVLLDLVPNHTSDQHPWFIESRKSRDNPYRDWYIWRDPKPDGSPPNNWLAYFGGPAWTFDETTSQYYMHNFAPQQPELNWRNPEVKDAMLDVIRFWLERGVDGFRMDVIDRIIKDEQLRDNPSNPNWKPGDDLTWSLLRLHSEMQPEVHNYLREIRAVFDIYRDTVSVGEVHPRSLDMLISYYGAERADGTGDEMHLPFNFALIALPWDAAAIKQYVDDYEAALPAYAWPNYVLGNHDVERIASRVGPAQARVAAMLLLTLRGTPTLYQGDELGMVNVPVPEDRIQDPQGKNTTKFNRDECRTPMPWDDSANGGFSPAGVAPWLPAAPNYATIAVAAQQDDPASFLTLNRRLLDLRRIAPALNQGAYLPVEGAPDGCFVYQREAGGQRYLVALNLTGETQRVQLDQNGGGRVVLSTIGQHEDAHIQLSDFALRPDEGMIAELRL